MAGTRVRTERDILIDMQAEIDGLKKRLDKMDADKLIADAKLKPVDKLIGLYGTTLN